MESPKQSKSPCHNLIEMLLLEMCCTYINQTQLHKEFPFISPGRKQLQEFPFDRVILNSLRSVLFRFHHSKEKFVSETKSNSNFVESDTSFAYFCHLAAHSNYLYELLKAQRNISSPLSDVKLQLCFSSFSLPFHV